MHLCNKCHRLLFNFLSSGFSLSECYLKCIFHILWYFCCYFNFRISGIFAISHLSNFIVFRTKFWVEPRQFFGNNLYYQKITKLWAHANLGSRQFASHQDHEQDFQHINTFHSNKWRHIYQILCCCRVSHLHFCERTLSFVCVVFLPIYSNIASWFQTDHSRLHNIPLRY